MSLKIDNCLRPSHTLEPTKLVMTGTTQQPVADLANAALKHRPAASQPCPPMICYHNLFDPKFIKSLIAQYTRVLERNPQNINALLNRGNQYLNLGMIDKAEADFNSILSIDKRHPEAMMGSGKVDYARGKRAHAMVKYNIAFQANPNDPSLNLEIGRACALDNNYAQALVHFKIAEDSGQYSPIEILIIKINCLIRIGNNAEAENLIKHCITAFPDHSYSISCKGDELINQNRLSSALRHYRKAIMEDPTYVNGYLKVARIYDIFDEYPKAVETLNEGLKYHPGHEELLFKRALFEFLRADERNYTQYRDAFITAHPRSRYIHLLQGSVELYKGDFNKAESYLMKYLAVEPSDGIAWYCLGKTLFLQNKIFEGFRCFNRCLQINPFDHAASCEIAIRAIQIKQYELAKERLEKCAEHIRIEGDIDEDSKTFESIFVHCQLAVVYTCLNDVEKAVKILNILAGFNLFMPHVDSAHAKHLMVLGKYAEAFQKFEKVVFEDQSSNDLVIKDMIACKWKLGTLSDLEQALSLFSRLQGGKSFGVDLKNLKQNITADIKKLKAQNTPPKANLPSTKRHERKRNHTVHCNKAEIGSPSTTTIQAEDGASIKIRQDFEARMKEEQRATLERLEKEKNQMLLKKQQEAEILAAEREIARKQRESTRSYGTTSSRRLKSTKLETDFQKQKKKMLEEEKKAAEESAEEIAPKPVLPLNPPPIVTVFRNTVSSQPAERQFAPEVLNNGEVYIKPPAEDLIPPSESPVKKADKAPKKNIPVMLMDKAQSQMIDEAFAISSKIEDILQMSASTDLDKQLHSHALLYNLRRLLRILNITNNSDAKLLDLMNKKMASNSTISSLNKWVTSMEVLSCMPQMEAFCRNLAEAGLFSKIRNYSNLHAWPVHETAVADDKLTIPVISRPSSNQDFLNLLKQELTMLAQMGKKVVHPHWQDSLKMGLNAIEKYVARINNQSLKDDILKVLNVPSFEELWTRLAAAPGMAQQTCQRIKDKFRDLEDVINVHSLVE